MNPKNVHSRAYHSAKKAAEAQGFSPDEAKVPNYSSYTFNNASYA